MNFRIFFENRELDGSSIWTTIDRKAREISTRANMAGETISVKMENGDCIASYINGIRSDEEDTDPRVFNFG